MYLVPTARGTGAANRLLAAAEELGRELGATRIYLETGDAQPEAIRLYERNGYSGIPLYPPYSESTRSISYAKTLVHETDG
jgi:GNAT superfamily N-acetyltransferase